MRKIAFFGYTSWASLIATNLVRFSNPRWSVKSIHTANYLDFIPKEFDKSTILLFYGWSWMIPKEIYDNYLCLICHISPLPKYRGGSPIQNQIINGEKVSAVTILRAAEKVDTGDIYSQSPISLNGTLNHVFERIVEVGTRDTIKVLDAITSGTAKPKPQDNKKATYYKRRQPEESELTIKDFQEKTAEELYNFIRCLNFPYPNAFIKCKDGKNLYFTEAHL